MRESHVELSVGDAVSVDGQILTVIDIQDGEVTFRIDEASSGDATSSSDDSRDTARLPR
jgi:riboflavin synthase alpha subunit